MNTIRREFLDEFGEQLMQNVRDDACDYLQRVISGRMRDKVSAAAFKKYKTLEPEAADVLHHFLLMAIDACLVRFLYFIETKENDFFFSSKQDVRVEIRSLSDGLAGEVHTEDGWFARFSKFKESIDPIS